MISVSGELLNAWIAAWLWPFVRILSMLLVAPVYDQRVIPATVKIGLASLIALILAPILPVPPALNDLTAMGILIQQIAIGLTMGFSLKIIFTAFQIAGDIIGLQMGLAFAQFIEPGKSNVSPLLGTYLTVLASLFFLVMDGHLLTLDIIIETFKVIPVSSDLSRLKLENIFLSAGMMFSLGVQIALPVVLSLIAANVIMGILTKAAPQMNLLSIGFSIILILGMFILSASIPSIVSNFDGAITRMLSVSIVDQ